MLRFQTIVPAVVGAGFFGFSYTAIKQSQAHGIEAEKRRAATLQQAELNLQQADLMIWPPESVKEKQQDLFEAHPELLTVAP